MHVQGVCHCVCYVCMCVCVYASVFSVVCLCVYAYGLLHVMHSLRMDLTAPSLQVATRPTKHTLYSNGIVYINKQANNQTNKQANKQTNK